MNITKQTTKLISTKISSRSPPDLNGSGGLYYLAVGWNLKEVAEYMQNLLYGLTPEEVKAGKRAKPDSTPIKYTVTIKWIPNLLVGMMATQNVLGWSSAESRKKLSKLPVEAHVTEYWYRAWNIFKKLSRLSIEAEVTAVNNLGQILDNRYAMAVNEIDLYKVKYGRKAGFMDDKGYLVIPCEYRFVEDFKEGLACVTKNGRTGFINKFGREVVPCQYDSAHGFSEGMAVVWKDRKYGFVDKDGNEVVPFMFSQVYDFHNGLVYAHIEENWVSGDYYNKSGEKVTPKFF